MTFTLSIQVMLRQLYARGAMAWAGRPEPRPDILRPAHEDALRELLRSSFARLCLDLLPIVSSTNLDEVDPASDPFFILELDLPRGIEPSALRAAMEQATALRALTGALTDIAPDEAEATAREAAAAISHVRAAAALRSAAGLHLTPSWV